MMLVDLNAAAEVERKRMNANDYKLFKKLKKLFDSKSFKPAIKASDELMAKATVKNQQNILFIKAICQASLNDYGPALATSKMSLMHGMDSFDAWYIYATLNLGAKNREEAHKAFAKADNLTTDRNKVEFYKDWNYLSFARRDYASLQANTYYLLNMKSDFAFPWLTMAEASSQLGHHDVSFKMIDYLLQSTLTRIKKGANVGYRNTPNSSRSYLVNLIVCNTQYLHRAKRFSTLIDFVQGKDIKDTVPFFILAPYLYDAYSATNRHSKAEEICCKYLEWNPENMPMVHNFIASRQSHEPGVSKMSCLRELSQKQPASSLVRVMLILECDLEVEQDRDLFIKYVEDYAKRGQYGIFKSIYSELQCRPSKLQLFNEVINDLHSKKLLDDLFYIRLCLLRHTNSEHNRLEKIAECIEQMRKLKMSSESEEKVKKWLIAKYSFKVGKYDQAQLLMNSAFESLKTSKHFCTKAMKYHLWQNDAAEASRCGQYFAYEAKNVQAEPDQHFLNSNFLRYVTYKTLNCIEHDQWREALISCFEVKKLIEEYHTSLYDLYIYSSYHGTMNMLTRAYDAYSAVLRTKDSLLAMILGYKLSMACHTQKLEFKFPHDRAKTPIDGAHQFLKMLFKGHPNLSLTHRMAVEYYVTTKNQVACLRSLNQLLKLTSSVTYEFYCSLFVEAFGAEGTLNDGITSLNVAAELRSATKQHDTEMPYGLLWAVNVLHGDEKKLFERQMACQETTSPEQRRLMKLNEVLKIL